MRLTPYAATAAIAGLLLVGCQQRDQTAQTPPAAPAAQVSAANEASTADPSVPKADTATAARPDQDAASTLYNSTRANPTPAAQTGTDASAHSALSATERDREMPMKGQANDYNTPDRAKEGDQPNTASKEPGGQEANPGNATHNTTKETTQ
jgi:hypothetical protein